MNQHGRAARSRRRRVCLMACATSGAVVCAPILARAGDPDYETVAVYETVVVAPRASQAGGERSVDAATIATTPRSSGDDLLRLVPGLLISRHGAEGKGRQIFLRGFDAVHGADLEVTVDGVPWNEASNVHGQGYLDFGMLIPEAVRRIDAEKGSYRLGQGPFATAGSVRFGLGIDQDQRGARAGYEIGSSGRHRVVVSAAPSEGESFVVAEGLRDNGYGANRQAERLALVGRLALPAAGQHTLDVTAGGHASRFGEPGTVPLDFQRTGRTGFLDSMSDDTAGQSARAFLAGRWAWRDRESNASAVAFLQARQLRLQENFTGFLVDAERGDRLEQRHRAVGGGLRLAYDRLLVERLRLIGGLDTLAESIDQHEDRIDARHAPFARTRALGGTQGVLGARVGLRWLPHEAIRLDGGLRLDSFLFDVEDRLGGRTAARALPVALPRASVAFAPHEAVALVAAYGRGVRPPEARAVAAPAPSNTAETDLTPYHGGPLRPTVSDGAEVGVRLRPAETLEVGLEGFGTFVRREQVFDHLTSTNLELNATRRLGVEADATWRPRDGLELRADLTAVDARFVDSGRPVPGAPTLFGAVEAHLVTGSVLGGARVMVIGPRPLAFGATAGAAAIADLMVGWRHRRVELSATVENLLDSRWREGEFNYASWFDRAEARSAIPRIHYAAGPPLTFRLGATVKF